VTASIIANTGFLVIGVFPLVLLLLLPFAGARRLFRLSCQTVKQVWLTHFVAMLHYGIGVDLVLHMPVKLGGLAGLQAFAKGHDVIIISNHHTRIDWMFIFGLALAACASTTSAIELTADNFEEKTAGKTVFIKFQAPW